MTRMTFTFEKHMGRIIPGIFPRSLILVLEQFVSYILYNFFVIIIIIIMLSPIKKI